MRVYWFYWESGLACRCSLALGRQKERAENRGREGVMSHGDYVNTPHHPWHSHSSVSHFFFFFEGCTVSLHSPDGRSAGWVASEAGRWRSSFFLSLSMSSLPASFHPQSVAQRFQALRLSGVWMLLVLHHPPAAVHIWPAFRAVHWLCVCVCVFLRCLHSCCHLRRTGKLTEAAEPHFAARFCKLDCLLLIRVADIIQ